MRIIIKHLTGSEGGRKDVFPSRRLLIGRDEGCDLRFDRQKDLEVSGRHAEIVPIDKGGFEVVDLQSTNGTWLNGVQVERAPIESGDVIELGAGGPRLRFLLRRGWRERLFPSRAR